MVKGFMKKHGLKLIVPLYMIFYLASFHWLEQRQTYGFHEIYSSFDSAIPFCEVFIIPYVCGSFILRPQSSGLCLRMMTGKNICS